MLKWKASTLIIVIAFFVGVPLLIDWWIAERHWRKDKRDDELVREYECNPPEKCVADFNGDGIPDRVDVAAGGGRFYGWLVAYAGEKEILRLPYDSTDGTLRTHTAIRNESGKSRLMVYDGASHRPSLKAVFAWNGENLMEVSPTDLEREILNAMAAHDDTGGWNERTVFRPIFRIGRLIVYYTLLCIVIGVVLYKRFQNPIRHLP
jgi:hypothetical protein